MIIMGDHTSGLDPDGWVRQWVTPESAHDITHITRLADCGVIMPSPSYSTSMLYGGWDDIDVE
jgi:hypothetical protein